MIGQSLGVIAGRGGDDAALLLRVGEEEELVQRAPLLEGGGELLVFEFDPDFGAVISLRVCE